MQADTVPGARARLDSLEVLLGHARADLAVTNGRIVDVYKGEVRPGGVAIKSGRIVKVGDISDCIGESTDTLDARNRFVTPGLIETHAHGYHSNLNMTEYARICLRRGTTSVPEAFYGVGQIRGLEAVRVFMNELRRTPINILFQIPVLAYLQNVELGLSSTPGALTGPELFEMLDWPELVGLEEPPWIPFKEQDPFILRITEEILARGKQFMGHGAGLRDNDLVAYAAMGVTCDHEAVSAEEAVERVQQGMLVSMRECSVARNQRDVQRAITEYGCDPQYFTFCSDVPDAVTLATVGHIDENIRIAVEGGIPPVTAVQMATVNAARYYRLEHELGSLTPGRRADLLLVGDLGAFDVQTVIAKGRPVIVDGEFVEPLERPLYPEFLRHTVKLARPVTAADMRVTVPERATHVIVRVIGGETLASDERHFRLEVTDGSVVSNVGQDVLKLAMFDRYGRSEKGGIGFIQGYHLQRGAIGTSYNPFFNGVMTMGTNDDDMAVAANEVARLEGGFVAVVDGEVLATVPLPLCGLLSDQAADTVVPQMEALYQTVADMGCTMAWPFHNLAFAGVAGELPFLKMSDTGPFDVVKRQRLTTLVETE
jgi:adenine deaminase